MRRPYDSYLLFDHKTDRGHKKAVSNYISEKERLTNEIKEEKKRPATKQMYLISFGTSTEKRQKHTTSGYKQTHNKSSGSSVISVTPSSRSHASSLCEGVLPEVHKKSTQETT